MNKQFAKHEISDITRFEKMGFTASFIYRKELLVETKTKNDYTPEQIFIVEELRYEGMSNPADSSLLYVIKTIDDIKGTFLVAYGAQADIDIADFFKTIPDSNYLNSK